MDYPTMMKAIEGLHIMRKAQIITDDLFSELWGKVMDKEEDE